MPEFGRPGVDRLPTLETVSVARPVSLIVLALNIIGAFVYVMRAAGGWRIAEEHGSIPITGEPFVWFAGILPVVIVFFVLGRADPHPPRLARWTILGPGSSALAGRAIGRFLAPLKPILALWTAAVDSPCRAGETVTPQTGANDGQDVCTSKSPILPASSSRKNYADSWYSLPRLPLQICRSVPLSGPVPRPNPARPQP